MAVARVVVMAFLVATAAEAADTAGAEATVVEVVVVTTDSLQEQLALVVSRGEFV